MRLDQVSVAVLLGAAVGGCSTASLPALTPGQPSVETGNIDTTTAPIETAITAPGTPTEVYALVARGALGCWFGANGPLKATHSFHADAAPPAQGGAAEIIVYERTTAPSERRTRAFRVAFAGASGGVRVGIESLRVAPALAQAMVKDVEVWAKGGTGCEARAFAPAPAVIAPPAKQVGSGAAAGKKR